MLTGRIYDFIRKLGLERGTEAILEGSLLEIEGTGETTT